MAFTMMASVSCILFLASLTLTLETTLAAAQSKQIHLHFYMHDITGGPGQTAMQIVKGGGPAHPSFPGAHFGDTTVIDDALTEGPNAASRAVGRAQGSYMLADLKEPVLIVSMTVLLTGGAYNGSTITIVGQDDVSAAVRELTIAGGTSAFRRATGHVLWRTAKMESRDHLVLELDVYATVPGDAAAVSQGQRQAGVVNTE